MQNPTGHYVYASFRTTSAKEDSVWRWPLARIKVYARFSRATFLEDSEGACRRFLVRCFLAAVGAVRHRVTRGGANLSLRDPRRPPFGPSDHESVGEIFVNTGPFELSYA